MLGVTVALTMGLSGAVGRLGTESIAWFSASLLMFGQAARALGRVARS